MKSGLGRLAEQVRPERGIREQQMSSFYKGMLEKMDTDKDGQLSERELFAALQHPEMGVRDIVARMIVKHQSEWFGGSSHQKWTAFFQNYDILRIGFVKKWLDDMEWMSQVEPFSSGQAVWHMHPVMFLDALSSTYSGLITLEMVFAANLNRNKSQCEKILPYLNKYAQAYNVKSKKEIAHFLSQVGHESQFNIVSENLNYSPKRMRKIYGCKGGEGKYDERNDSCIIGVLRGKLWSEEGKYAYHPENLANYVYGNRMDNGDEESGDGYKYRGRGMIQLTGKSSYRDFTAIHNRFNTGDIRDFVNTPDLLIEETRYGVESAFAFWVTKTDRLGQRLNIMAKTDNVKTVTKIVNGGLNGYKDRVNRFNAVAKVMGIDNDS
ncbi:Predicted chitinase [Serratia rubidaea]|uniref:Predicted chitinase n=2 Tax=Serratia rubidaea TaxID=61652 RepID=A0A3S4JXX1_SERRU|nr:Predicted chitinase [Serratia rubidaea]